MILKTARLVLRDVVAEDLADLLAYQADPRYQRFYPHLGWEEAEAKTRELLEWRLNTQRDQPRRNFELAITLPAGGWLISSCRVSEERPEAREASLGYELNPAYWGCGYATEAARAMLTLGFRAGGFHRIYAHCVAENTASAHVLEKLGLRQEGRLRDHDWVHDRWWDQLIYAILEEEWRRQ